MTKAEIEALLERVSSLPDGNAWPSTIELICDMRDALLALAEENERLKLQRDEAREQFDKHVAWASDQQAAAEARAIAAEEALKLAATIADEERMAANEAFHEAEDQHERTYRRGRAEAASAISALIPAALAQKEGA